MKLSDLFNIRRYRRCRRLFRAPMAAHVQLAMARPGPLHLPLVDGGVLSLPNVRHARKMLAWLLGNQHNARLRSVDKELVELQYGEIQVVIPPTDESFFTFSELFLDDCYQLARIKQPLGTVIDLGTNIGLFATRIAPMAERVICVEAVEENLAIAHANVQRAQLDKKVSFHHRAIAGESGRTEKIFLSEGNRGGHSICCEHASRWGTRGYEEIQTISLADLFHKERIDCCSFLKCDIEGAEYEVFAHVPEPILRRIDRIAMETHLTVPQWSGDRWQQLCDKLQAAGFRIQHGPLHDGCGRPNPVVMLYADRHAQKQHKAA